MEGESVSRNAAYSKTEVLRCIGRNQASWRSLKRDGLRTIEVAGGAYVLGSAWLDYLAAKAEPAPRSPHADAESCVSHAVDALASSDLDSARHHLSDLRKQGFDLRLGSDLENEVAE